MKTIFRTAVIAALILTTSCGKDSAEDSVQQLEQEVEKLENTPLEANTVSDNVLIDGGTKVDGESPVPNGTISLDLSNTAKSAFLDIGFDVTYSSDKDVVGAYLRFKSEDGAMADSYYDINVDANSSNNKSGKKTNRRIKNSNTLQSKTDDAYLDVNFNSTMKPGKFCYEICVYDAEGNISEPQEVCIQIEGWGGYEPAIGEWKFEKWYYDNASEVVYLADTDNCSTDERSIFCANGLVEIEVSREWCLRQDYMELVLNADGTYIERDQETVKDSILSVISPEQVNLENIDTVCDQSLLSRTDVSGYNGNGKWAYLKEEDKLIFVEYDYEEIYRGEVYSEFEEGDEPYPYYGFDEYNGNVNIVDGKLIISSFEQVTVHYAKE